MRRFPFFIEFADTSRHSDVRVCQYVMMQMFRKGITPLPFATNVKDLGDITRGLHKQGLAPALFVVNTYLAEEQLALIDPYMGETPALFFRRELFTSKKVFGEDPMRGTTVATIGAMTPRECSIWNFGSQNANAVSERAAAAIAKFLQDDNFRALERVAPQNSALAGHT